MSVCSSQSAHHFSVVPIASSLSARHRFSLLCPAASAMSGVSGTSMPACERKSSLGVINI